MGTLKDEERVFMVVDKDTGKVYDLRNERHIEKLTETEIARSSLANKDKDKLKESENERQSNQKNPKSRKSVGWNNWWKKKLDNDMEFLKAAEIGDLPALNKYLDVQKMKGQQADVNATTLDDWTALHLACRAGHVQIV